MDLARRQELFLDAAELSFAFIKLTYDRLVGTLGGQNPELKAVDPPDAAVLDAWVIVDLAERLREVLERTPGLKENETLSRFSKYLRDSVKALRDHVQHLEEKAAGIAPTGFPIWGSISWAHVLSGKEIEVRCYIPGRLAKCEGVPIVNPAGRRFRAAIDHVELTVNRDTINVSELCRRIGEFGVAFNAAVDAAQKCGQRDSKGLLRFQVG